jgi:hypothetical protein
VRNVTGNAIARIMLAVYHKIFRSTCILPATGRIRRGEPVGQPGILPAATTLR